MSFYNKDKNPFPFYKLEGDVWTNTKPLWFKNNCKGCCYMHRLPVGLAYFQLQIDAEVSGATDITVNVRKASDNTVVAGVALTKSVLQDADGLKYLIVTAQLSQSMLGDDYYISVASGYSKHYSEVFCVSQIKDHNITIEWSSTSGKVGNMVYLNNFKHSVNIDAVIVQREPEIEEETEEDGFGNEIPTLQILKQSYEMSFVVPNFIAQALAALPLHDKVNFINKAIGEETTELVEKHKYVTVKATPELDNCNSYVEITFTDETITKTACANEVIALNNPPMVSIVWNETSTTEPRLCEINDTCTQTLNSTVLDPDGNLDTLEWERSDDLQQTWTSLGAGTTKVVTENALGKYNYRLKATDTNGLSGYSNVLGYKLYDDTQPLTPVLEVLSSGLAALCASGTQGATNQFNITATANQLVKAKLLVTEYYGAGFVLQIKDRSDGSVVFTWTGGPLNSSVNANLNLEANGIGEFSIELCLNPCSGTTYTRATVLMTLLDTDNVTETDQDLIIEKYLTC